MADLGALTTIKSPGTRRRLTHGGFTSIAPTSVAPTVVAKIIPVWVTKGQTDTLTSTLLLETPGNGRIYGVVSIDGTPLPNCMVGCYYRATKVLVVAVKTNALGQYEFLGLNPSDEYTILAYDPAGSYQGIVQDRVMPEVIV